MESCGRGEAISFLFSEASGCSNEGRGGGGKKKRKEGEKHYCSHYAG